MRFRFPTGFILPTGVIHAEPSIGNTDTASDDVPAMDGEVENYRKRERETAVAETSEVDVWAWQDDVNIHPFAELPLKAQSVRSTPLRLCE
ncbi:hypothetical protein BLNAU_7392 [Blattamonas nauphoetae]|uniref:Uncharacterized protein n=1 Tax=Blattamonas nauphoetae TaxID=2049346 RepID=A0ABQ9Y173_9EUKA|nr:hypothetical protein BLNAU_7392 [Blattamonas nauphoetae]